MDTKKEELMAEAKELGLEPHPNTGQLKLKEMIDAELSKGESAGPEVTDKPDTDNTDNATTDKAVTESVKLTPLQLRSNLRKKQLKLIRVVINCNNDKKKEWTGEIHTVICAAGTLKKWVPFGNEKGWHVPQAILDVMKAKTCQKFRSAKLANGQEHNVSYSVKEYNIEILKPLTEKEIKELAADQSARGSIDAG